MRKYEKLEEIIKPAVETAGYDFVGIEYHANSVNSLLRVFVDKDGGVNLDGCIAVNEQVSAVMDINDPLTGKYTLEISSPGLDRPLFSLDDFSKFIGSKVKLRLSRPIERRRNFKGYIKAVDLNSSIISLEMDDEEKVEISYEQVEVARLIPVFK